MSFRRMGFLGIGLVLSCFAVFCFFNLPAWVVVLVVGASATCIVEATMSTDLRPRRGSLKEGVR